MSGYVYLQGDIRATEYKVPERGLFAFGFTSGVSTQIEVIDERIAGNKSFAIVPDHSHVAFIGRIIRERDIPDLEAAAYQFIVDAIVMPREKESEGIDA